ncbi:VanW family protein [Piscinibacter terrae]|uniref:Glycosyltransferase n=1 Tax=Piscinibacter terrae TaxID=2496871 RepID=A0A3N7J6M4_9BURK|nr:VanW family protein [Albitalea terrae]RQP26452.1 glycosyltransferase [Albitalea terrae]
MSSPATSAWRLPTRSQAVSIWLRSRGLMLVRAWHDWVQAPVRRWPAPGDDLELPVVSEWRSALWDTQAPASEWSLVAGKVQNLRIAAQALNGAAVPAGETFSFWKQVGRVRRGRGFAVGREVRAGCVIPTLGGGLCQLSNALATCAVQAGFTLVERHGHSAVLDSSRPELVDATLFWNYVDLRIRSDQHWQIEAMLTDTELIVRLRGTAAQRKSTIIPVAPRSPDGEPLRGCLSCDERACFRHRPPEQQLTRGTTALLLDTWTPEFERHLHEHAMQADALVPRAQRFKGLPVPGRASWHFPSPYHVAWWTFLLRAIHSRLAGRDGGKRQATVMNEQRRLAAAYARRLRPQHTHVIVDQALLPHLAMAGVLQGRKVTVLAHSLPMHEIERRLDEASLRWPDEPSLKDFRADPVLAREEELALRRAHEIVCSHRELAACLRRDGIHQVQLIDWAMPDAAPPAWARAAKERPAIVFPCSALARKGQRELAQALRGIDADLLVLGTPSARPDAWPGLHVTHASHATGWLARADVVVMPAHIEHSPRAALRAIAAGVPVIATAACGLESMPGVQTVPAGDADALRAAIIDALHGWPARLQA